MTTEERLDALERELGSARRRNRWLPAVAGLAMAGLAVGIVALVWTPKTIRARSFIVEGENGAARATLQATILDVGGWPGLTLYDENGKRRAWLSADKDGAGLILFDENLKGRAGLNMDEKGTPILSLCDENGKVRVALGMDGNGAGLGLSDENGKVRVALSTSNGGPGLALADENGKVIWRAH